ncbi:hypothetical protein OEZ86_000884 [Tetradesmus obliquus]|nr:hypothetical protein OEZ86_000884 [Tetradesmus obliquus]
MAESHVREKRALKRPAWLLDGIDPCSAEAEGDASRQPHKRHAFLSDVLQLKMQPLLQAQLAQLQQQLQQPRQRQASQQQQQQDEGGVPQRMCLNEFCKSPFESPQWRRGPLGPGTLCNACGTRYARMEAKKKGDKRGAKLRPQDLVEWAAFQEQLQWPLEVRQAWVLETVQARLAGLPVQQEQQQQQQQQQDEVLTVQQQEEQQQQQQQPQQQAGVGALTQSSTSQQGYDQADDASGASAGPEGQLLRQQQQQQQQVGSLVMQRASAAMLCRVQQGSGAHSQHQKGTKRQQPPISSSAGCLPLLEPELYQAEADITARLAGLMARRQQQQQQQQRPRQAAATSRCSSSSSAQAKSSWGPAAGRGQQRLLGCENSSGRDQLLQLLAVGEALFNASEDDASEDKDGYAPDQGPAAQQAIKAIVTSFALNA